MDKAKSLPSLSSNLDFLRAYAVLSVLAYHLISILDDRVADFAWGMGRFGVLVFFVHTSLVLMLSLERGWGALPRPVLAFYVQRCFRIYPLAIACVVLTVAFRLPVHSPANVPLTAPTIFSNLLLTQNLTLTGSILGPMWSLPYEIQMYVLLPALFLLAGRFGLRGLIPLWCAAVLAGLLQPSVSARADLAKFAPCFIAGVIAYRRKPARVPRLPFFLWPVFLSVLLGVYILIALRHDQRVPGGWWICGILGLGLTEFREPSAAWIRRSAALVARYSYGIYLIQVPVVHVLFVKFTLPQWVRWPACLLLIGALSVSAFHFLESPLIKVGRNLAARLPGRQPQMSAVHAGSR